MKKIFTLMAIISVPVAGLWAQATPNAGFETWTTTGFPSYEEPNSWNTANAQTNVIGTFTCIKASGADKYSGSYAVKLVTKQIGAPFNVIVPGVATTGTLPSSMSGPVTGGIPYTLRPDSITGWYKYTSVGGENGFIGFLLFGPAANNADTIGSGSFATPASSVGTYTRFSAAMTYTTTASPVNSMWMLASSNNNGAAAGIGSTLFVDDLGLVFNPTTAVEELTTIELTIGPNPASDFVAIHNASDEKAIFVMYDFTGRKIVKQEIQNGENIINVSSFPSGLYSYSLSTEDSADIKTGNIILQK